MAGCNGWTYYGISDSVFKSLQNQARRHGTSIPNASSGTFAITAMGMTATFSYRWDKTKGVIALQCIRKPVMVSCSMLKKIADDIILASGGRA